MQYQPGLWLRSLIGVAYIIMGSILLYYSRDFWWVIFGTLLVVYGAFRFYRALRLNT